MTDNRPIDAGAPEIEITPEMVDAGVESLWRSGVIEHPLPDLDQEIVRQIFLAMLGASRPFRSRG